MTRAAVAALAIAGVLAAAPEARADDELEEGTRLVIGVGAGVVGQAPGEPRSRGAALQVQALARLTSGLDLVGGLDAVNYARYAPDPAKEQSLSAVGIGVRWRPFPRIVQPDPGEHSVFDPRALLLRVALGAGHVQRGTYEALASTDDSGPWGFAAGGAVGWMPFRYTDYAFGFEVGDHVTWFEPGRRHLFFLTVVIQLSLLR